MAKTNEELTQEILSGVIDEDAKTYTFMKEVVIGGQRKKGTFKTRYMGIGARLRVGTLRAKLLEGAPTESLDTLTDDIAYMIAYLTVNLIETPQWWNYDLLDDVEDLTAIFQEVYDFNRIFRESHGATGYAGRGAESNGEETVENS